MFEKFGRKTTQVTLASLLAALGVGGVAVAQNGSSQGSTSTPPAATSTVKQAGGDKADGPEKAGDKADGPEKAGESGSEVAGNDGPGGHADEPGNPNANTQLQGQQ